jgi:hypothetical protein
MAQQKGNFNKFYLKVAPASVVGKRRATFILTLYRAKKD